MGVSWAQVRHWRLSRQYLHSLDGESPVAIASRLGGVQAQVFSAARLAIASRQASPRAGDTDRAVADAELVRTWAMRGTLHLLPRAEAPGVLSLLAAAKTWEKGSWQRTFVTKDQIEAMAAAVTEVLRHGACLSRAQLLERVVEETGDEQLAEHLGSGWSAVLKPLAWQGLIMQGPATGGKVSFVSPAQWLGPGWPERMPDPDEAAGAVIERYLAAFGPSTPAAFDQWLLRGATPKKRLRAWFADLDLTEVDVEGTPLLVRSPDVEELATTKPTGTVRLLAGFDQFVLGPGTADPQVVPPEHRGDVSRAAGWIAPVVLVDGRVAGTWSTSGPGIETTMFGALPRNRQALLRHEVERMTVLLAMSPGGTSAEGGTSSPGGISSEGGASTEDG